MSDDIETKDTVAEVWGMKCPSCGDCDHICVAGMTLTVGGPDADIDHAWLPDTAASCGHCDFDGTVVDFEWDRGAPTIRKTLENIAREHLGFETLERRGSDRLDFKDVSVWSLKDALTAAYEAGKASTEDGKTIARSPAGSRDPSPKGP